MVFIDGENLVCRFQEMAEAGNRTPRPEATADHIKDVFVWEQVLAAPFNATEIVRVAYYTSAQGDDDTINAYKDKIAACNHQYGVQPYPVMYKKIANKRKTKLVDMAICIDSLRHAYQGDLDIATFVTGDGDYVHLVREIQRMGRRVRVMALSLGLEPELRRAADFFVPLDQHFFQ
jgi:uncharacterized LabA/DUF88 family protein